MKPIDELLFANESGAPGYRAAAKSFEDLIVWQKAYAFVLKVYRMTEQFPKTEVYGLISQFRRAAISIPANIAEGFKKRGRLDKARLMNIAQGSIEECHYYLILARDLGYVDGTETRGLLNEVGKMIQVYVEKILDSKF